MSGDIVTAAASVPSLTLTVPGHGVRVLISTAAVSDPAFAAELDRLQQAKSRP